MKKVCLSLLFLVGLYSFLSATTIVPYPNMGVLSAHCDAVVQATALETYSVEEAGLTRTACRFRVEVPIKGTLQSGQDFLIRSLSHRRGNYSIHISGDFEPVEGTKYLLFLQQKAAFWQPECLSYYVYEEIVRGTAQYWVPVMGNQDFFVLPSPDGVQPEARGVYHARALSEALAGYQSSQVWQGMAARSTVSIEEVVAERALPVGCDFDLSGGTTDIARWQNDNLVILHNTVNAPGNIGTILTNTVTALNTNYTGIDPVYSGAATFTPNCAADGGSPIGNTYLDFCDAQPSQAQTVLVQFEDPCGEIPALNGCVGILAYGGSYTSNLTHSYKSQNWFNALYGFVVVNNGTLSCLSQANASILFSHELTHAYNMDHLSASSYPNNNMNPSCCAAINTKDRECMNYTYDIALPIELTTFEGRVYKKSQAQISWQTNAEDEADYFQLYHSTDGWRFEVLHREPAQGALNGSSYTWIHKNPVVGDNFYRLSYVGLDGSEQYLGLRNVVFEDSEKSVRLIPNPVAIGETPVVSWRSGTEGTGVLEVTDSKGSLVYRQPIRIESGNNTYPLPIANFPGGLYIVRVQDDYTQRIERFLVK